MTTEIIRDKLGSIVCDILDIEEVDHYDSLTDDLGLDSIDFLQLISAASTEFNLLLSPEKWKGFIDNIIEGLKNAIVEKNIEAWKQSLNEFNIEISNEFIDCIIDLKEKGDEDSFNARIFSLLNVHSLSVYIKKLQES